MPKSRTQFLCNQCGSVHPKWLGKCPDCGTWDSLEAYTPPAPDARAATADALRGAEPVAIGEIDEAHTPRLATGIAEFDRVLGGGIVPGSVVLVGGEPGIGKSTLLLQVAHAMSVRRNGDAAAKILYVTSEESARQTALRARRLGVKSDDLLVLAETNVERITHQIAKVKPAVAIVDSIQMIYKPQIPAAPGSVTQLRDCCMDLVYLAKASGTAVVLVGHVTKAGTLAGPKVIEHIVDTVAYFEGDRFHAHRIVRCAKNRFGGTHEVGLFEMSGSGLSELTQPGKIFLEQYGQAGPPSGSVVTAAMQGTRVLLVEVQALTAPSVIGAAKRKTSGVSSDRVAMILAVLEKLRRVAPGRGRRLRKHRRRNQNPRAGRRSGDRPGDRLRAPQPPPGSRNARRRRTRPRRRNPFRPPTGTSPPRSRKTRHHPGDRPPAGRSCPEPKRHGRPRRSAIVPGNGESLSGCTQIRKTRILERFSTAKPPTTPRTPRLRRQERFRIFWEINLAEFILAFLAAWRFISLAVADRFPLLLDSPSW